MPQVIIIPTERVVGFICLFPGETDSENAGWRRSSEEHRLGAVRHVPDHDVRHSDEESQFIRHPHRL